MENPIKVIKACRVKWLNLLENYTIDQLNYIPDGFNNNLAWQLGHVIVSQQILCYKLAGLPFVIENELIDLYKNGSKPERAYTETEIAELKHYALSTISQLEMDMKANKFINFTPYTISTYAGITLNNVEDAINFIVSHDGLHYGCSLMLGKLVK